MNSELEYKSSLKCEVFESHYLTKDQLNKLIQEKLERAENYLLVHRQVGKLFACD
jgi:hypothetical protein